MILEKYSFKNLMVATFTNKVHVREALTSLLPDSAPLLRCDILMMTPPSVAIHSFMYCAPRIIICYNPWHLFWFKMKQPVVSPVERKRKKTNMFVRLSLIRAVYLQKMPAFKHAQRTNYSRPSLDAATQVCMQAWNNIFFLPRHRYHRPHPGFAASVFPLLPRDFGGRRNLPLFCSCKDKHRRCRGEKKKKVYFQTARLRNERGGKAKKQLCFPNHKTVPRRCRSGKHFFLITFCNTLLQIKTHKKKISNIYDSMLFHSITGGALLILTYIHNMCVCVYMHK